MLKLCVEKRLILQSKIENKSFQGNVKATFSTYAPASCLIAASVGAFCREAFRGFHLLLRLIARVSSSKVVGTSGFEERRGMSVNMKCPVSGQDRNRHDSGVNCKGRL